MPSLFFYTVNIITNVVILNSFFELEKQRVLSPSHTQTKSVQSQIFFPIKTIMPL